MKLNDTIDMKGRVTLKLHDASGNLVEERAVNNAIVMTGRDLVAKLFIGLAGSQAISHIAVGTSATLVNAATDSALGGELKTVGGEFQRKAFDKKIIAANADNTKISLTVSAEFGNDIIGALTEAGIFNAATNGVMYNRVVFDPINKPAEFKLTLIWEILF